MVYQCPRCGSKEFAIETEVTRNPVVAIEKNGMIGKPLDYFARCRYCNDLIGKVEFSDPAHHWEEKQ